MRVIDEGLIITVDHGSKERYIRTDGRAEMGKDSKKEVKKGWEN